MLELPPEPPPPEPPFGEVIDGEGFDLSCEAPPLPLSSMLPRHPTTKVAIPSVHAHIDVTGTEGSNRNEGVREVSIPVGGQTMEDS
jgi:hypothetical protein